MIELKPCARCGSKDIGQECRITPMASECYCWCRECDAGSPSAPSQEQACVAWNEAQEENGD